jgi:hypothetical protein
MASNAERGRAMGYGASTPAVSRPAVAKKTLYGQQTADGDSYGRAISSFHDRTESGFANDRENLKASRDSRTQHLEFFRRFNVDPDDAHRALSKVREYQALPRSAEARQKIAERTFESLRLEHGDAQARELVQNHNRFMDAYRASVPWVAGRAASTGANLDLAVVRIGAKYGAQIPTK